MSKDPLGDAEAIASSLQGAPTGIRFIRVPKVKTGLSLCANIVGVDIVQLMSRKLNPTGVSIHASLAQPPEAQQGIQELTQQGIITVAPRGRVWTDIAMPDPQWRNRFSNWDGDHQNRVSNMWEEFWYAGLSRRWIRVY